MPTFKIFYSWQSDLPGNKTRNIPVKTVAVITLCSIIGVISRYIFVIRLGLPLTIAAIVATCGMLTVIYFSKKV